MLDEEMELIDIYVDDGYTGTNSDRNDSKDGNHEWCHHQELLCLNKSVSDMTDSIAMLEAVLKQKLDIVDCQINGTSGCM